MKRTNPPSAFQQILFVCIGLALAPAGAVAQDAQSGAAPPTVPALPAPPPADFNANSTVPALPPPQSQAPPAPGGSSGLQPAQNPDHPPPFDPTAAAAPSSAPVGQLPNGSDLSGAQPPRVDANGFNQSLAPPPGMPAPPPQTPRGPSIEIVQTENPSLYKLGPKDSYAVLKTSYGRIVMKLFTAYAPHTVRNFVDLAKGEKDFPDVRTGKMVRRPFYNGLLFHRVIRGFLVHTGCPFGTGRGTPGYAIPDEIHPGLRFSRPGVVAMSKEVDKGEPKRDTAGSQFFITLAPRPDFDGKYSIFAQVVSGMDVLRKIGNARTGPTDRPIRRIVLQSIEVVEK